MEPATIVDYDPRWPMLFDELCRRIRPALDGVDANLEHVGSTAVPGLAAKPVVDLDVVVASSRDVPAAIERLVGMRDYLRRHPVEARRYGGRKLEIAPRLGTERAAYLSAKRDLVEELLRQARLPSAD